MANSLKDYLRGSDGLYTRPWIAVGLALLVTLLLLVNHLLTSDPHGEGIADDLEREFQLVRPLPEASSPEHTRSVDPNKVYVMNTYETSVSYDEILSYYDSELPKQGWKKCGGWATQRYGISKDEITAVYCKQTYRMHLIYDEFETELPHRFKLRLDWS